MSRGLTQEQITQRLQEGRNYKRLHGELKVKYDALKAENKQLREVATAQAATIAELQAEVKQLRAEVQRLRDSGTKYRYYLFPDQRNNTSDDGRHPPQRLASSYVRPRPTPERVTERKELLLASCPRCQGAVSPSVETFSAYVEDIVFAPQSVTEYTVHRQWCRNCSQLVRAPLPNALPGMTLGLNTVLYVLVEHYRARKTDEQVVESLGRYFGLSVSSGEVSAIRHTAASYFVDKFAAIVRSIQEAAVNYADETGWYVQGQKHGQCWHLSAPEVPAVLFHLADSRAKDELQGLLGNQFHGVTVSDFYTVYDGVGSEQQKCWVHLLRDSHLHARASPDNEERRLLHAELTALYKAITAFRRKPRWNQTKAARLAKKLSERLQRLAARDWQDSQCQRLAKRVRKYRRELLTCLRLRAVLPENNTAERGLRPVVIQRKITNGNRSPKGARTYEVNMSVIETIRAEGGELLTQLKDTLWQKAWAKKFGVASLG